MKSQTGWMILLVIWCVWLFVEVAPSDDEDDSKTNDFKKDERRPNKEETEVCGTIRDVIQRDSGRFRRILIRNTNSLVSYNDEDARRMTSRTESKLDVLASLVDKDWENVKVRVLRAWTDQVVPSDLTSLHYEGRSVRLETSDKDIDKLGRLAALAVSAGFDWVEYTTDNYIRASVIPDVCQTSVDLVFVLDGSGSVGEDNFNKVKDFVKRVIDFFNIGVDGTHVSVVTYETRTHIEFNLVKYFTKNDLRNAVDDIEYRGFLTYTGEALNKVRESVLTKAAGMREDVGIPKVLVLLTDGYSNGDGVLEPSNKLRQLGVSIFSIGVGPSVSRSELNAIASDPNSEYVFTLGSFNQLAGFVDRVSSVSCSEGSLINSCGDAETSVESGSFRYFRTVFDIVTTDKVSVEVRDLEGTSHLYASNTSKNPGPLDSGSVKNEDNSDVKAVSVALDNTKTIYVAVQGQKDVNKFRLSFWDNLFQNSGFFQVDVKEGQSPGEVLTLDMVPNNPYSLKYSISPGIDADAFSIEKDTPKLSTSKVFDYEKKKQYSVVVVADDLANACHRSRASVQINVIDVNDNAPKFANDKYTASIDENAQNGAFVKKVFATDADSGENGRVTYTITSSTSPGLFEIDSFGEVSLNGSLDFETESSYTLTITARDHGSPSMKSTAELTINVADINEEPSISCDGNCVYTVSEDVKIGTVVGGLSAEDPDKAANCLLTYSMPTTAAEKFTVTKGNISTVAELDREERSQYVFYITVHDCGSPPLTARVRVTITVSDVNDNKPQFPGPYSVNILESESTGSTVVQVKATDADEGANAEIKYTLNGAPEFRIHQDDGTITTASKLDYEHQKNYTFTVTAQDQGTGGSSTGQTQVTVNVIDENDNAPSFVGTPYAANVKENSPKGTPVIDINATDSDSGPGGDLKYSITSGNVGNAFTIHEDTGLITVSNGLDQETTPSYTLVVEATDQGEPSLHSEATVIITVGDTNDNSPVFQGLPYTTSVPEDFGTIQPILTVFATDDDAGTFGEVTYSIESPTIAKDTFSIDNDGKIRVKKSLDYETKKDYVFTIVARDGGNLTSQANINIDVTDVNDHEPRFEKNPYNETVAENMNVGHVVGTVKATDEDSGQRGSVTYSIKSGGNTGNAFTINADGEVIALIRLDRETKEFYTLTIEATDGGTPAKSSRTKMEITVLDKNDNAPVFDETLYSFMVKENNDLDAEVGQFGPATDSDKGANGEIVYTISGDPSGTFEYDSSGKLIAKKVLDRETTPVYDLVVKAEDKGSPSLSVSVPVQVVVLDVNDNRPMFAKSPYNCTIDENSATNTRVCIVSATDADAAQNGDVTYALVTSSTTFSVDQNNGEIKALVTLDREQTPFYSFVIIASDGATPPMTSTVTVNVRVLDKNDNKPKFNQSSYSFNVSEDAQTDTEVGSVFADDEDEGLSGEVVYRITSGNTGLAFSIDRSSGLITVKSSLDRETIASYKLIVEAADRGTPSQSSSLEVVITVTDVNDHDPIFTADPYHGTITEDASIGSPVVQVSANDADEGINSAITYSITDGDDKDHFMIDEDSGFINTATKLDYESKKSYLLTVTATNGGDPAKSDTARVNITIENANDNAPTFEPGSPLVRVSETVAIGTNVVKFNATDRDGSSLTFSLTSGNTGNTFSIDKDTGVLTTNATLDRETVARYNLTVTVTEANGGGGGKSSSRNLTVIVTDENDNKPRFNPNSYTVNVVENTGAGLVVTVTATDEDEGDNAEITYSIDPTSAQKFTIDSKSGGISTKAPLDYEESPRYVITVTAKDGGTPSLSSTAEVVVTVEDLNDNNPDFNRDYATSLLENTAEGTEILAVEADDPDSGANGEVQYNITAGNDEGFFTIGGSDGIIKVANPPDREQNPSFTLLITARNKVPAHSSATSTNTTTTVTITIDDVNDNAPNITNTDTSVEVQENSPRGTPVLDVDAVDRDIGVNSEIEFAIVDGNVDDAFVINTTSGVITVQGDIDRETREDYTLKVLVSDKGNPVLSSEKEFFVNVTDLNDNKPAFIGEPYEASVSEAANISTFVIQIEASDADAGSNGDIKFSIVSGDDQKRFQIDAESGDIVTNGALDFETVPSYTLVVRAEDPSNSIETNVLIRLVNINDNSPIFNPASYAETIGENHQQGYEFLTLTATDEDPFGGLTYTIVGGNIDSRFTLEPGNGKLRVAGELDRESNDFYNLTVRVTDGGARSDTAFVEIRITDINDNAPKFNKTRGQTTVRENSPPGTPVLKVLAEDSDFGLNGSVRYEITEGNDKGLFQLGENSGQLTVGGNIDRETIPSFSLKIVAEDKGSPPMRSSPLVVDIEVLDANDNTPKFTSQNYSRSISERSSVGSFVEEVQATDADIGLNREVVYSLFNGSEFFKINNESGVISTNVSLDRENIPSFTVIIIAKDLGTPSLNSTATLFVTVLDVNDNPPRFDPASLWANVTEEQPKGQFVIRLVAKDADEGPNAEVEYGLDSNAQQFLNIDSKTGVVTTNNVFDFEAHRNHTFNVIAYDKGSPPLSTTASLHINVIDTDDNCPVFNPKEYNLTIQETGRLGSVVVTVYATDVDTVGQGSLEYGIRQGNTGDTFGIKRYTGEIVINNEVDRELATEFNVVVRAGNDFCGVNITGDIDEFIEERRSKSIAKVNIFVTDVNDNAPKFLKDSYQHELKDIDAESLLWVNATDPDYGINAEFVFGLAGVTRVGATRTLTVTATDKGTPQQTSNTTVEVIGENCEAMTFSVSPRGHVSVKTLCKFDTPPSVDGEDLVGEKITFKCVAVGNTVPEYRWTKNGVPVTNWKSTGDYVIKSLRKSDAGSYACIASSEAGNILSGKITIVANERVKIVVPPKTTWVQIGNSVNLSCLATGDKPIRYSWQKDGEILLSTAELKFDQKEIAFQEIIEADEGEYTCLVVNPHGSDKSEPAMLNVFAQNAVVEMDINLNNPRVKENCHLFNITSVTETLNGLLDGNVAVVEFEQPDTMCNLTACSSDPCLNQGSCLVRGSGYVCQCPRGWAGKRCEIDANECETCVGDVCTTSKDTCRNNGTCINRKGSFSCSCLGSSRGKLCQFASKTCDPKRCPAGQTCYPKENELGHECIANAQTVSMEYKLEKNRLPFENWMIYDIAQDIENAIATSGVSEVSQGVQGGRKRRDTGDNDIDDIGLCSVRIENFKTKDTILELTIILVCEKAPKKSFVCDAMLAEGKVKTCTAEDDKKIVEPETTEPPSIAPLSVTVVFIARDQTNKDASAIDMVKILREGNIEEKLKKDGMTVVEIRTRTPTIAKQESDGLSSGVIAGIIIAVVLLMLVAAVICFVILRTRNRKHTTGPTFSFMTMAERSPTKTALRKQAASVRDLNESDVRGVMNTAYEDETDGARDHEDLDGKSWFMVQNPEFTKHKVDYMEELEDAPWYYGKISREKAETILDGRVAAGTFIVRSGQRETEFYISARAPEGDPKIRHIEVDRYDDDFVAVLGTSDEAIGFSTFGKLIAYLRCTPTHFEGCENDLLLTEYVDRLGITIL